MPPYTRSSAFPQDPLSLMGCIIGRAIRHIIASEDDVSKDDTSSDISSEEYNMASLVHWKQKQRKMLR